MNSVAKGPAIVRLTASPCILSLSVRQAPLGKVVAPGADEVYCIFIENEVIGPREAHPRSFEGDQSVEASSRPHGRSTEGDVSVRAPLGRGARERKPSVEQEETVAEPPEGATGGKTHGARTECVNETVIAGVGMLRVYHPESRRGGRRRE